MVKGQGSEAGDQGTYRTRVELEFSWGKPKGEAQEMGNALSSRLLALAPGIPQEFMVRR